MAQTLDEFVKEQKDAIEQFEKWWRQKNAENAEHFPMTMKDGREGLWWEFLQENYAENN